MVFEINLVDVIFSELKKEFVEQDPHQDIFMEREGNAIALSNPEEKLSILNLPGNRFYLLPIPEKEPARSAFYTLTKKIIDEVTGGGAIFCN